MVKQIITWDEVFRKLRPFDRPEQVIYGVPNGGMILTSFLKNAKVTHIPEEATFILDDVVDSGKTRKYYSDLYPDIPFYYLIEKSISTWYEFPWETEHPSKRYHGIEDNIIRQLQYIGEDVKRQGILETPERVVRSWKEIYSGYNVDVDSLFKIFDGPEQYDQMIVCKNIELYSMCEHHMLPFYGKAHIAYIPQGNRVIGISKLARLVDAYARRLQLQERICEQVTSKLMEKLQPLGAACVIEAKHLCMTMRGVNKQHSIMTTSSMKGVFLEAGVKEEFLNFII